MLPVVDKPLIQYAVEEAVAAGITDLIFVTGRNKRAIEDHFDSAPEMEHELARKGKAELLAIVQEILPSNVSCIYIRQSAPLGLGHAVLTAAPIVGDEPFAVLLADDLLDAERPVMGQLIDAALTYQGSILGVQEVPLSDTDKYGIVATEPAGPRTERVRHIVEKPKSDVAPSTLAVVGRYVLDARILRICVKHKRVRAVRSSSQTESPPYSKSNRSSPIAMKGSATTAATKRVCSEPLWRSVVSTTASSPDSLKGPRFGPSPAAICRQPHECAQGHQETDYLGHRRRYPHGQAADHLIGLGAHCNSPAAQVKQRV
jgi:dTDP-glucose pyrophosphorylase